MLSFCVDTFLGGPVDSRRLRLRHHREARPPINPNGTHEESFGSPFISYSTRFSHVSLSNERVSQCSSTNEVRRSKGRPDRRTLCLLSSFVFSEWTCLLGHLYSSSHAWDERVCRPRKYFRLHDHPFYGHEIHSHRQKVSPHFSSCVFETTIYDVATFVAKLL